MSYHISFLLLPYTRLELPGWGYFTRVFKISAENESLWKAAPTKSIRDKYNGYLIKLDLADWSERLTFFLGRYYDLELQLVMSQILKAGDRFVDIGANIGLVTLHGAALVTSSGCIDSFEPNPTCCKRIRESLELNDIKHVHLHEVGLSDQPEKLLLSIITEHSGMSTLTELQDEQKDLVTDSFEVLVLTGDEVIMNNSMPVKLVKIDVEGFELRVLKGLRKSLTTWHPIVVTEVVKQWLARAGTSRKEVFQFMNQLEYSPYGLTTRRQFLRHHLALTPILESDVEDANFTDFLWLHPESSGIEALRPFIYDKIAR